ESNEKIEWLEKCEPSSPDVRSELCQTRGTLASQAGNNAEAESQYRQAIKHLDELPESASNLNNSALVFLLLSSLSGDHEPFKEGMRRLEKAISLRPRDSILIRNSADAVLMHSLTEIIGPAIDRKVVKGRGNFDELSFLYADAKGRAALVAKLSENAGV